MRSAARPSASPERRALSGVDDSAPATSSYWSSMREAMRCTAPMNAPSPPPAPAALGVAASLDGHSCFSSNEPERAIDLLLVDCAAGEIVERLVGDPDDVMLDELGALARAVLGVLQTAFPLEHRPGRIAALRELGEDAVEV